MRTTSLVGSFTTEQKYIKCAYYVMSEDCVVSSNPNLVNNYFKCTYSTNIIGPLIPFSIIPCMRPF